MLVLTGAVLAQGQLQEGRRLLQEGDGQSHLLASVSQNLHLRGFNTKNRKIKGSTHAPSTARRRVEETAGFPRQEDTINQARRDKLQKAQRHAGKM